jgi:hypothetical protein
LLLLFVSSAARLRAEVELPLGDPRDGVTVVAQHGQRWREGIYEVWTLQGACRVRQGDVEAQSQHAVIWIDRTGRADQIPTKLICYLEGNVQIDMGRRGTPHRASGQSAQSLIDQTWLGRFFTLQDIAFHVPVLDGEPAVKPDVYQRGWQQRQPQGFANAGFSNAAFQQPAAASPSFSGRRIRIQPRSSGGFDYDMLNLTERNETVIVAKQGVSVIIEGALFENVPNLGTLDLGRIEMQADNIVAWTSNMAAANLFGEAANQPRVQPRDLPLELYLEGNIIFRQGRRVIYADRMYYDVRRENGLVLNAEVLTPVMEYDGLVRLKADVLQQLDKHNFAAYGAAITSSRIGHPRYWLQSERISLQDVQQVRTNPLTGLPEADPISGEADVEHQLLATSSNNFLYVGSTPVFYWPVIATDVRKPTYYLDNLRIKNDSVFGFQILTDWDAYQLLGMRAPPEGTNWTISGDYLSDRGPAAGTQFTYDREQIFGFATPAEGLLDAWAIRDDGLDNLGLDRRALVPEEEYRGRVFWQHRQFLPNDLRLTAELGLISDRNFLEQYFEQEWDQWKDQTTGLELKRLSGHQSWSVTADARLNDFFTQTEWLPRVDHYMVGHSLLGNWLTWHAHSHAGYGHVRTADPPTNPVDAAKFDPLAWEFDREGIRAGTRQELDMPLQLGPVKVVPYLLGEVAHWGEVIDGDDVTRLYGQTGIRTSLPVWRVDPQLQSELLNLNGLAHKITLESEVFIADANEDLSRFPLYDPLDDDSVEFFRRRYFFDTFGGMAGGDVPLKFDERNFAFRSGLQSWVAGPSTEIADDLLAARLAVRQRWQTKRGLPGRERIVDWVVLDIEGTVFPEGDRDNFGEEAGMLDYDFRWHVGDRLTLLSDGFADLFADGLRTFSVGGVMSRPGVGRVYLGYRSIEGPLTSNIITGSLSYRMSEKWIFTAGAAYDLGPTGNIGQTIAVTRIGESALMRIGLNVDESRDNVGVQLAIEPRFLPRGRLGDVGGVNIPPAGALGLE